MQPRRFAGVFARLAHSSYITPCRPMSGRVMMGDQLVGAIDQGTSSSRFALFDRSGVMVASAQRPLEIISSRPGWAEHDPMETIASVKQCINDVMKTRHVSQIVSVGITNQRETLVAWDLVTGVPLYNAILWLDTRTSSICRDLEQRTGSKDSFRSICGLPISTYFSGVKMIWLMENVPAVATAIREQRCMIGTIDSWLIWNLTGASQGGIHITDVTNASRTMLFDLKALSWSKSICEQLKIPMVVLPRIVSNSDVYGNVSSGALKGLPIAGCIGDQHAAMLGQMCFGSGTAKTTYGTGAFMLFNTGASVVESKNGLLSTVCYKFGSEPCVYALEGSIAYAGAIVQWLRDNLNLFSKSADINTLATSVENNGGVYFVTALSGLLAPHWRDDARGLIIGITQHTTKAHICRAALESVCFSVRELVNAMEADSGVKMSALRADGGMAVSDTLLQLQANILGLEASRPAMLETTALGAAIAAGLATGYWTSPADVITRCGSAHTTFAPNIPKHAADQSFQQYRRAIERSVGWAESEMTLHEAPGQGKVFNVPTSTDWTLIAGMSIASAFVGALISRIISGR